MSICQVFIWANLLWKCYSEARTDAGARRSKCGDLACKILVIVSDLAREILLGAVEGALLQGIAGHENWRVQEIAGSSIGHDAHGFPVDAADASRRQQDALVL